MSNRPTLKEVSAVIGILFVMPPVTALAALCIIHWNSTGTFDVAATIEFVQLAINNQ